MQLPQPVTKSDKPLVLDTLPAVKTAYYHGCPTTGNIYTYGRFYALAGRLVLGLSAFERQPDGNSRIGFAIGGVGDEFLFLALGPATAQLWAVDKAGAAGLKSVAAPLPGTRLATPAAQRFAGQDEQGWYWGAQLLLAHSTLARAGVALQPGEGFLAAVYKYREGEDAYGASAPFEGGYPLAFGQFGPYTVVSY